MPQVGRLVNGEVVSAEDRLYDALLSVLYRACSRESIENLLPDLYGGESLARGDGGKSVDGLLGLVGEYLAAVPNLSDAEMRSGLVPTPAGSEEAIPF